MRKWIVLLILLLTSPCFAVDSVSGVNHPAAVNSVALPDKVCGVAGLAAGAGCPAGTYVFAYDGDHASGAGYACWNDGATNEDGTVSGATVSSAYVEFNAVDKYIEWNDQTVDDDVGTIWFDVYFSATTGTNLVFESYVDANNKIQVYVSSANALFGYHNGNNNPQTVGVGGIADATWQRVAYSWKTAATASHAVNIGAAWTEIEEAIVSFSGAEGPLTVGEHGTGQAVTNTVRARNVYYVESYKATDPM